jgi:hypothetical protein
MHRIQVQGVHRITEHHVADAIEPLLAARGRLATT